MYVDHKLVEFPLLCAEAALDCEECNDSANFKATKAQRLSCPKADDMHKAKAYYEKAISLDPFYPEPHKAIGLMYYKDGEKTLAKKSFGQCLSLSPHRANEAYIVGYLKKCNQ